jgi:hypothetical protein
MWLARCAMSTKCLVARHACGLPTVRTEACWSSWDGRWAGEDGPGCGLSMAHGDVDLIADMWQREAILGRRQTPPSCWLRRACLYSGTHIAHEFGSVRPRPDTTRKLEQKMLSLPPTLHICISPPCLGHEQTRQTRQTRHARRLPSPQPPNNERWNPPPTSLRPLFRGGYLSFH